MNNLEIRRKEKTGNDCNIYPKAEYGHKKTVIFRIEKWKTQNYRRHTFHAVRGNAVRVLQYSENVRDDGKNCGQVSPLMAS
ncbi:MAG: hypothetical protein RBS73_06040 [Prolixibacteraceae bacterium]|jgi:hypothetical protein|nr:hypothetical protein [Prolixibacteraceae bacterium]